jgi:tetratricopeptide (TPR) repeat protein
MTESFRTKHKVIQMKSVRPLAVIAFALLLVSGTCHLEAKPLAPTGGGQGDAPRAKADRGVKRLAAELRGQSAESYRIAKALAQVGEVAAAKAMLKRAVPDAADGYDLLQIGRVQAEVSDRDAAVSTLLEARQRILSVEHPESSALRNLADVAEAQLKLGERAASEETFKRAVQFIKSVEPDKRSLAFQEIVEARAEAGDFAGAVDTAASIADVGLKVDALGEIGVRRRKIPADVLERIVRLLESIGDVPPDLHDGTDLRKGRLEELKIEARIALAQSRARADDSGGAQRLMRQARKLAQGVRDDETRSQYLWEVVTGLVRIGATDEASRLAATIQGDVGDRKILILREVAEAHEEGGDHAAAAKAWRDALPAAGSGPVRFMVLMDMARAQWKAGDGAGALRTLQDALSTLARTKASEFAGGRSDDPRLARMAEDQRTRATASLAKALAEFNDVPAAIRVARSIGDKQFRCDALAHISGSQAGSGDIKGALQTAESIEPLREEERRWTHMLERDSAVLGVISAQARAGDLEGAFATADRFALPEQLRFVALIVMAEQYGQGNHALIHKNPGP